MHRAHLPLLFSVVLATLVGCTAAAPTSTVTPTVASATNARGGQVVLGQLADIAGLNPIISTDPQSTTVSQHIYESLLMPDPKTGDETPRLAQSWTVSPDGRTLTFVLRPGLLWSDGSSLTADDVAFTIDVVLRSPKAPRRDLVASEIVGGVDYQTGQARQVSGVTVTGNTISVQLTQPSCTSAADIGGLPVLPREIFSKYMDPLDASKSIDDAPENSAPPVSSGPFIFKEWVPRDHVTLVRNDRFFLGPPALDTWVYRVIPNPAAMVAALKTGEIDMAMVGAPAVESLQAGGFQVFSTPGTGYTYIAWNALRGGKEFFQDVAVRQALSYGLDWNQIIATLMGGQAQRVVAHTPPASWAYDPTGLNDYAYNPQKARDLLEGDGWSTGPDGIYEKNGQRLAFTLLTNPETPFRAQIIQIAAEQYRQIGVEATPRTEAFEAFLQRTISSKDPTYGDQGGRDVDAYLIGWAQIGPDPYLYWHSSQTRDGLNRVGYQNSIVDQAIEDARANCDPVAQKAAYHRMDLQLNHDQPVSFGFVTNSIVAVNPRIHGVDPGPYSYLSEWNVERWVVANDQN